MSSCVPCDDCHSPVDVPDDWPLDWGMCVNCVPCSEAFPSNPYDSEVYRREYERETGSYYPDPDWDE